jgi:hypothetical protein
MEPLQGWAIFALLDGSDGLAGDATLSESPASSHHQKACFDVIVEGSLAMAQYPLR